MTRTLNQELLNDTSFWKNKNAELPSYDRQNAQIRSICFSAGRMAFGHTGDILQDILNADPSAGCMVGIETFSPKYCAELEAGDCLATQLVYGFEKGQVSPKIQGAIKRLLFIDDQASSVSWNRLKELASDPRLQWGTINAPEGAYGFTWHEGLFAEPTSDKTKADMSAGTLTSDAAKWTAFAMERYKAGLRFALVSCTNFSENGRVTGGAVRTMAKAWEDKGFAPKGFTAYLSDPALFSFPNCMIDRIAVAPDETTKRVMDELSVASTVIVTEKTRYWVVEDLFPAGRPDFERAEGVLLEQAYEDIKKYEDMKLRILNMSHSTIAGLGVLLGYRGKYGIYRAMRDPDLATLIDKIVELVSKTIKNPRKMDCARFAADTRARLNNPNIPDDPMRIALNASTKMKPRFMDTWFAGKKAGLPDSMLDIVLLPVAGFLRYTLGVDDSGQSFSLEDDPMKEALTRAGNQAVLGKSGSSAVFHDLIASANVMGSNLYEAGPVGKRVEELTAAMLSGPGAVRALIRNFLA